TLITWNLRDDIKWSDGVHFTSADVKFTLEYLRDNKAPRYLSATQNIVKVETPDKYTAKVYFSNTSYWNIDNADYCGLPQHIWKDVKDYKAFEPWKEAHPTVAGMTKLVGLGPFVLKEYKVGEYVRMIKNVNYFALPTK
ncbi:MAG TPA: ABC transporter substrate-binding protein, partial [Bacillota bacterium]|nr:ABC transporter substrate-binding protein [Bacillota bacterium]